MSAYESQDRIWTALRRYPNGATVKQIAFDIQRPVPSVGARLSKMYYYDVLERIPMSNGHVQYLYRVKK